MGRRSAERCLLVIQECFSGRSIAKLSARKAELEVLFGMDTYFEAAFGWVFDGFFAGKWVENHGKRPIFTENQ